MVVGAQPQTTPRQPPPIGFKKPDPKFHSPLVLVQDTCTTALQQIERQSNASSNTYTAPRNSALIIMAPMHHLHKMPMSMPIMQEQ
jgi:hypothetical protein